MYKVIPTHQFERAYKRLNRKIQDQVDKTIDLLMIDPRHPSLRTHKRKEDKTLWQPPPPRTHKDGSKHVDTCTITLKVL